MSEITQGVGLIGPVVEPIGYKRIVRTIPTTGEVIDADLFVYCISDTKADSKSGRAIRYYEGHIEERESDTSVDSDRSLMVSTFELTQDVMEKAYLTYDAIVQGTTIDIDSGDTVITGPDLQYYHALLVTLGEDASTHIKTLEQAGVFDFESDDYNSNVYDAFELQSKIDGVKRHMINEVSNIESAVASFDTEGMIQV